MNAQTAYRNANTIALLLAEKKKELSSEKKSILKDLAENKRHEIVGLGTDELIRVIQFLEGRFPCFQDSLFCSQKTCRWQDECTALMIA